MSDWLLKFPAVNEVNVRAHARFVFNIIMRSILINIAIILSQNYNNIPYG